MPAGMLSCCSSFPVWGPLTPQWCIFVILQGVDMFLLLQTLLSFFHGLFLKKYWIVLEKSWQRHLSGKLHLSLASNFFLFRLILPQHLAESMNTFHSCLSMLFQRLSRSTIKWSLWSLSAKKGLSRHVLVYDPSGVVFSTWSRGASVGVNELLSTTNLFWKVFLLSSLILAIVMQSGIWWIYGKMPKNCSILLTTEMLKDLIQWYWRGANLKIRNICNNSVH